MTDLYVLAGSSTPAIMLLRAADHDLTGLALDRTIKRYANLGCGAQRGLLYIALRDTVERWHSFENDPAAWPGWTPEQMDAEVLHDLYQLVAGQDPCRDCLNGSLLGGLDAIHPAGHQHRQEAAA